MNKRDSVGFTLIELLVAITIIAVLVAIVFPVFAQAREKARETSCLSNMKQIDAALMMYVQDYDETFPGDLMAEPSINPDGGGMNNRMPYDEQLHPYIKNDQVFACPSDNQPRASSTNPGLYFWDGSYRSKGLRRSYEYVAEIDTDQAGGVDENTGLSSYVNNGLGNPTSTGKALNTIVSSSNTIALIEAWPAETSILSASTYLGCPSSAAFANCDLWKLAGRTPGVTSGIMAPPTACSDTASYLPTPGHFNGSNYMMVDGSTKFYTYSQIRQNDFYLFKIAKPATAYLP